MGTTTAPSLRRDWTLEKIESIYTTPLLDLIFQAQLIHREPTNGAKREPLGVGVRAPKPSGELLQANGIANQV